MEIGNIKTFEQYNFETDNSAFDLEIPLTEWCGIVLSEMCINYETIEELDGGANGVVMDLGNSVFKITTDKSEAYYAHKLISIDSPNLVKTFDVKVIKSDYQYGDLYVIHMEKLNTNINSAAKIIIDGLYYKNPIVSLLDNDMEVSDELVISLFSNFKMMSKHILLLYGKWLNIYNECKKYDLPIDDLRSRNVGGRVGNMEEIVFFDISSINEIRNLSINDIKVIEISKGSEKN